MAFLANRIYDAALAVLDTEANRLDITTSEATTYTQAITTFSLGNKTSLSIGAPADRTPSGRKVTVAAVTSGGSVTGSGTAAFWAITDTVNSRLLATGSLASTMAVVVGSGTNTFTLPAFDINIPGAV